MTRNGNNLTWRVTQLEKSYYNIDDKLEKIMTNELPHLHEELSSLRTRINVQTTIQVGALILGTLILKYL